MSNHQDAAHRTATCVAFCHLFIEMTQDCSLVGRLQCSIQITLQVLSLLKGLWSSCWPAAVPRVPFVNMHRLDILNSKINPNTPPPISNYKSLIIQEVEDRINEGTHRVESGFAPGIFGSMVGLPCCRSIPLTFQVGNPTPPHHNQGQLQVRKANYCDRLLHKQLTLSLHPRPQPLHRPNKCSCQIWANVVIVILYRKQKSTYAHACILYP